MNGQVNNILNMLVHKIVHFGDLEGTRVPRLNIPYLVYNVSLPLLRGKPFPFIPSTSINPEGSMTTSKKLTSSAG